MCIPCQGHRWYLWEPTWIPVGSRKYPGYNGPVCTWMYMCASVYGYEGVPIFVESALWLLTDCCLFGHQVICNYTVNPAMTVATISGEMNDFVKQRWLWAFLRWWPPSTMWAGTLIYYGHHRGCLNNPIFSNLGLCAACWAHFTRHHELWPTSVSHPFSTLNSYLGLAEGKHYQKITFPIFRLVIQNFAVPGYFPLILFYCYIISLFSSGWFVIAVCGSVSVMELVK